MTKLLAISKFRIAVAFVVASIFFSISYSLVGQLTYSPYWGGMAPKMDLSEGWPMLVILIIPISFVIVLVFQLIFVLPIFLVTRMRLIKNIVFTTLYIASMFFMTSYLFGQISFQPPQLQVHTNGLSGPRELMSVVQPEEYAEIYKAWQQDVIRKCINIILNGLVAGVIFWRIYSGSFSMFLKHVSVETDC